MSGFDSCKGIFSCMCDVRWRFDFKDCKNHFKDALQGRKSQTFEFRDLIHNEVHGHKIWLIVLVNLCCACHYLYCACHLCCACHCVMLLSLCFSVVIMFYCYCVALLLFVSSYVLIVCTVPLPPGVNLIAVDKYIKTTPKSKIYRQ